MHKKTSMSTYYKTKHKLSQVDSDDNGRYYTYNDLYRGSLAIADHLRKLGVKKGDVVGACCLNFIEIPALIIATALNGAIYSPFNPSYTECLLSY